MSETETMFVTAQREGVTYQLPINFEVGADEDGQIYNGRLFWETKGYVLTGNVSGAQMSATNRMFPPQQAVGGFTAPPVPQQYAQAPSTPWVCPVHGGQRVQDSQYGIQCGVLSDFPTEWTKDKPSKQGKFFCKHRAG